MDMRKYAADNLLFLREQYPEIYKFISNRSPDPERYQRDEARNGQANLVYRPQGQTPLYLYSRYDPGLEAERWAASMDENLKNADSVLVAGFGLGYHIAALINTYPEKRFYIVEPDVELFLHAVETVDLRPVLSSPQIAMFAVGNDDTTLSELLIGLFKMHQGGFAHAILPFSKRIDPELEKRLNAKITRTARTYALDIGTITHFQTEWLENVIVNMERNLRTPSFYPLKDAARGIPAIIAGSGPSLGLVAEALRRAKDHALLIAAGTATQALLHLGIEPHLIVSMDPGKANEIAFAKLNISHIPFLYLPTIKHTAIRDDESPYLMHAFFNIDVFSHYVMDLTPEDGIVLSTATVTGTAIQAAIHLGCTDIVFIGQDFSYPNQQAYASGVSHVPDEILQARVQAAKLTVPNVAGGENATHQNLLDLKRDVEELIKLFPKATFYNASPVGAVIENTRLMSLEEFTTKFGHVSVGDKWLKEQMKIRLKPYPPERIANITRRISRTIGELGELRETLRQVDELLSDGNGSAIKTDWFVRFESAWAKLVGHPVYEKILAFFLMRERLHAERNWEDMRQETNQVRKYRKLQDCVRPLVEGLKKLVPLMDQRMAELSEKLDRRWRERVEGTWGSIPAKKF